MCGEEIRAGSFEGAKLGFTSDLFGGYLIREKNTIKICYIVSFYPNEGNVTRFIKKILSMGYNVKVINPVNDSMEHICFRLGFKKMKEFSHEYGDVVIDIWFKKGKIKNQVKDKQNLVN